MVKKYGIMLNKPFDLEITLANLKTISARKIFRSFHFWGEKYDEGQVQGNFYLTPSLYIAI